MFMQHAAASPTHSTHHKVDEAAAEVGVLPIEARRHQLLRCAVVRKLADARVGEELRACVIVYGCELHVCVGGSL